ncbi:8124_t:CDS:2 [Diversispora eburnea]|uniref:Oxidation resistance protein 1 n=1 Tax=Diversispora eburnea TaxID=1213867 RepID=A0A9N8ZA41_9GLOM|nr:8124_t:CDS:2 [Diversispora eburnea]
MSTETGISSTSKLINEISKKSKKSISQKSINNSSLLIESSLNSTSNLTSKRKRKSINSKINDKNPLDFFWNIVGRDNYTISLNQSPVLCNSFSSNTQNFFGSSTLFANNFNSLPWRHGSLSRRVVPTMVPNKDDSTISLLTKTIKSGASFLGPSSYISTIKGGWDNINMSDIPITPPREETHLSLDQETLQPIELIGRCDDTDPVLNEEIADQIRHKLPRRIRLSTKWNLLYSLDQDGTSMNTMYYKVKDKGPLILTIKDMDDQVFGAFVTEPFKRRPSYYGTGEWSSISSLQPLVKFYHWTGRNEYIILSEHDYLAIGGGEGRIGLWIDSDLQSGHSTRCDTFDNDTLSSTPEFECMGLEVWGLMN